MPGAPPTTPSRRRSAACRACSWRPTTPRLTGPTIADNVTAHYACQGILAALVARERGGEARRVEVNMLEAALAFIPDPYAYFTQINLVSDPYLRAHTSQSYAFVCSDAKTLSVHLSSQVKFWERFVEVLARPELLADERFATRLLRITNYEVLRGIAAKIFSRQPRDHWMERLTALDIPAAPVYDVTEVFDDPQVKHMGSFMVLEHPEMGKVTSIRRPVYLDGSRSDQPEVAPPMLGEHTDEVLREIARKPSSNAR
jgi:crotonobetainyl-CoA:carnitine CoA-transferase CaiB-like acyl-CoA transferase